MSRNRYWSNVVPGRVTKYHSILSLVLFEKEEKSRRAGQSGIACGPTERSGEDARAYVRNGGREREREREKGEGEGVRKREREEERKVVVERVTATENGDALSHRLKSRTEIGGIDESAVRLREALYEKRI